MDALKTMMRSENGQAKTTGFEMGNQGEHNRRSAQKYQKMI